MIIYDTVRADEIEDGDQIYYNSDPLENVTRRDTATLVVVKGYSHNTGDTVEYPLAPDQLVELWSV